jgi:hypothetical protein
MMLMMKERRPAVRTLRGWAISVLTAPILMPVNAPSLRPPRIISRAEPVRQRGADFSGRDAFACAPGTSGCGARSGGLVTGQILLS